MITYLLPILIGYTGGYNLYKTRGGVVGAIATMGVIAGTEHPDVHGRHDHGPARRLVDEEDRPPLGRQDQARLRDAGQQLLRRHLGHDPGHPRLLRHEPGRQWIASQLENVSTSWSATTSCR
jgi:hypothetical protein